MSTPYKRVFDNTQRFTYQYNAGGGTMVSQTATYSAGGYVLSIPHRAPYNVGDSGGPFTCIKTEYDCWFPVRNDSVYQGPFVGAARATGGTSFQPTVASTSTPGLIGFGATAIARVNPNNPAYNLADVLGQTVRDVPRIPLAAWKETTSFLKGLKGSGNEYLNIEFGWLPMVSDIRKFARTVKRSKEITDQYVRNSSRRVRRRYIEPPTVVVRSGSGVGSVGHNYTANPSDMEETVTTKRWFSGAFVYYVPMADSQYGSLRRHEALANHLLGTRLTPEVLWDLAPWTWAIDWFTNVGDVMKNISNLGVDGQVMQYGYVMRSQEASCITRHTFNLGGGKFLYPTVRVRSSAKERVQANPYGFGITDFDLNGTQLAILAALGLSKGIRIH